MTSTAGLNDPNAKSTSAQQFQWPWGKPFSPLHMIYITDLFSVFTWECIELAPNQHSCLTMLQVMMKTAEECNFAKDFMTYCFPPDHRKELEELLANLSQNPAASLGYRSLLNSKGRDQPPISDRLIPPEAEKIINQLKNTRGPFHPLPWFMLTTVELGYDPAKVFADTKAAYGSKGLTEAMKTLMPHYSVLTRSKFRDHAGELHEIRPTNIHLAESPERVVPVHTCEKWDDKSTGAYEGLLCSWNFYGKVSNQDKSGSVVKGQDKGEWFHVGYAYHPCDLTTSSMGKEGNQGVKSVWPHGHAVMYPEAVYEAFFEAPGNVFRIIPKYEVLGLKVHDLFRDWTPPGAGSKS